MSAGDPLREACDGELAVIDRIGCSVPGFAQSARPAVECRAAAGGRAVEHLGEGASSRFFIDLQWFAAEDEGRTEEPTEQKIRKAREEGKVAKSSELPSALVILFPIIALALLGPYTVQTMIEMLRYYFTASTKIDVTSDATLFPTFLSYFAKLTFPVAVVAFIAAIMGNVLQVGFLFSTKPITPDVTRVAPRLGRFLRRSFFSGEALFNLAKSVVKVAIVGAIAYLNIAGDFPKLAHLLNTPFLLGLTTITNIAFRILVESALALLVLALPDYMFQRRLHIESLKMTKQEVKEERRQQEGDPRVRSRLRERMRELLTRNMIQNVPRADVVITNPTHFAVAMEWKRERMPAPMMVAKGADLIAFRIREVAEANNIPIIENRPLARALYEEVEIGDVIPEQYYEAMAIILAQVYRMAGKGTEMPV